MPGGAGRWASAADWASERLDLRRWLVLAGSRVRQGWRACAARWCPWCRRRSAGRWPGRSRSPCWIIRPRVFAPVATIRLGFTKDRVPRKVAELGRGRPGGADRRGVLRARPDAGVVADRAGTRRRRPVRLLAGPWRPVHHAVGRQRGGHPRHGIARTGGRRRGAVVGRRRGGLGRVRGGRPAAPPGHRASAPLRAGDAGRAGRRSRDGRPRAQVGGRPGAAGRLGPAPRHPPDPPRLGAHARHGDRCRASQPRPARRPPGRGRVKPGSTA